MNINLLTAGLTQIKINSLSKKVATRIAVLKPQRRKPLLCGFFTREISVHHYVGLGETLERVASSLGWYCNLAQSNATIAVAALGFKTLPTESVMSQHNHTPKPSNNVQANYNITCFSVVYKNNAASNYPLSGLFETEEQARAVLPELQKSHHDARVLGQLSLFSSEDAEGRKELINRIITEG